MPALTPVPALPEVTVPLNLLIPSGYEHYFNRHPDRPGYTRRAFDFRGTPELFPLVRAFLDTCAAAQDPDYRFLFELLGAELAANAAKHTRSGGPGGTYTLRVDRTATGLTLTCRDQGTVHWRDPAARQHYHLAAARPSERLTAEAGRGLALVQACATAWGDNGDPAHRRVWLHLDYTLTDSAWTTA